MKIPKIIYSTWISHKPLPEKFNKYIESWKKFLPDYEIRTITLENTPRNPFIDNFIENKKYAVAAQYARCQRIFETGGVYFDIDVEVVKSFDDLLGFEMFAGIESDEVEHYVNNAIFGAAKGHPFMQECMTYMDNIDVNRKDIEVGTGPLMFTKF
jgi:mannosyltransferase OCH1-like enzyme